ncbi:MAG: TetR/AcrR family transcriptional regulator [Actinomycetota bacterium]|nr:TetR/AcrR family transcriptional regulator [Actinomycetota bacterium]MDD5667065.1 TetR/AcrR family transcriptional regulator [Actinomycetota bacterium]
MTKAKTARKEMSRERILASAGSLLREKGISGSSVADVMEGAGMTVGGFYAHFPSKRSLVAEALREALRKSRGLLASSLAGKDGAAWVKAMAGGYLSRSHRDNPQSGCPLPATLCEVAREDAQVREALAGEIGDMVDEIASHLEAAGSHDPRSEALATLSTMVGSLTMARALAGTPLSDAVLRACRRHIERSLPG